MGRQPGGARADAPRFPCPGAGCIKSFTRKDHLQRHMANHDPNRKRSCPECGKVFARQDVLTAHVRKHEEEADITSSPVHEDARSPSPPTSITHVPLNTSPPPAFPPELQSQTPGSQNLPQDLDSMYAWLFSGAASELASGIDWDAWATKEPGPDDLFPSSPFEYELDLIIGAPSCSPCFDFSIGGGGRAPVSTSVRSSLLAYLATIPDLSISPYFSCEAIALALDLFWTFFAPQIPVLHRPTFEVESCSAGLLASLVAIGFCFGPATTEGDALFQVASSIVKHLRALILLWETQAHPVALATFQALCLLGVAGQQLLDRGQHIYSAAFSAFELSLGRSMDIFSHRFFALSKIPNHLDTEARWRAWIALESYRRLVFLIIMRDTQLCSMYHNLPTRALSVFFIRVGLPADEVSWQCTTAVSWASLRAARDGTLPQALKEAFSPPALNRDVSQVLSDRSAYAQLCVLHGLMATAWDLRWRGSLRSAWVKDVAKNWGSLVETAYAQHRRRTEESLVSSSVVSADYALHFTALDILLVAELELRMDLIALQTFAGAQEIAGRAIGPEEYAAASRTVRRWASSTEVASAVIVSATYLRQRLVPAGLLNDSLPIACAGIHSPFSVYLAAIAIWASASAQPAFTAAPSLNLAAPTDLGDILKRLSTPSAVASAEPSAAATDVASFRTVSLTPSELEVVMTTVLRVLDRSRWGLAEGYSKVLQRIALVPSR